MSAGKRKQRKPRTFSSPEELDEPHALDRWIERWGEVFGQGPTRKYKDMNEVALARCHARGLLLGAMYGATMLGPEPGTDQAIWELTTLRFREKLRDEPPPLVVVTAAGLVKTVLPRGTLFQPPRRTRR